jgi:hypothetical protein
MRNNSTITVSGIPSNIVVGDRISMIEVDDRWWMKVWYFMTFRQSPTIMYFYSITEVDNEASTLTVKSHDK